jgi:hypothetical protein
MHILTTTSTSLDDLIEPVDLRQSPADIVALSFTDSDLAALSSAWQSDAGTLPSMRLAALRDLRHPMSVDLWLDSVAAHAKVILVRILGGYDWWRYGCDQLAALCRARNIRLALLPGECRDEDLRLIECSTLPRAELDALLAYFREGGPENMRSLVRRLAGLPAAEAVPVPKAGFYEAAGAGAHPPLAYQPSPPQGGRFAASPTSPIASAAGEWPSYEPLISPLEGEMPGRAEGGASRHLPTVPILFYRSMLLAADVAPIDALAAALREQGLNPVPIFVASLKDPHSAAFVESALADLSPAAIVTATAFATGAEPGVETLFDRAGVPVFQVVVATTRREAWAESPRGLAPADLAMHVVMPELDGRILAGAISFKAESEADAALGFRAFANRHEPDRVDAVANRIAAMIALRATPRQERRLAILMPDYPGAAGRAGYAVGLDVPNSVLSMLHDLKDAGYAVDGIPQTARELLDRVETSGEGIGADEYAALFGKLPENVRDTVEAAWGASPSPLRGGSTSDRNAVEGVRRGGGGKAGLASSDPAPSSPPPPRLSRPASQSSFADPPRKGEGGATVGALLLHAWPDRVAKARGERGRFVLANGSGGQLDAADPLAGEPFLVVADLQGKAQGARIASAAAVSELDIRAALADRIEAVTTSSFDPQRRAVRVRETVRLGAITLSERMLPPPSGPAADRAIIEAIRAHGLALLPWSKEAEALRHRLHFLHRGLGEPWPDMDDAALLSSLDDWLLPFLSGEAQLSRIDAQTLHNGLLSLVPHDLQRRIGALAPTHFDAPSGSHVPLRYDGDQPVLAIRVQELFGLDRHPSIANGTVPLTLELLSPAHRPIQTTRDLPGFWRGSWADVRSDMRGRYPKHVWPDDPLTAAPTARAKPRVK